MMCTLTKAVVAKIKITAELSLGWRVFLSLVAVIGSVASSFGAALFNICTQSLMLNVRVYTGRVRG